MKKIIFAFFAVISALFTSCSNDEIEVLTVGRLHKLTCNVKVQQPFADFGIVSNAESYLGNGGKLNVFAFLYDANGDIVGDYIGKSCTSLNNTSATFEVPEGEYTLVTVQMIVHGEYWKISGYKKLSTICVVPQSAEIYFLNVVGVSTTKISLNAAKTINVVPNAIGSLVNLYYCNFENATYYQSVGFGTRHMIESYKFDPQLTGLDKYNKNLSDSDHFNLRGAMYKADGDLTDNEQNMTLYILDYSINYSFCYQTSEEVGTTSWYTGSYSSDFALENAKMYYGGMYNLDGQNTSKCLVGSWDDFITWYENCQEESNSTRPRLQLTAPQNQMMKVYAPASGNIKVAQVKTLGNTIK